MKFDKSLYKKRSKFWLTMVPKGLKIQVKGKDLKKKPNHPVDTDVI